MPSTRSLPQIGRATWVRKAAWFFFWTAVFAIAYTQSPLYTSNQNQYFLHGLARAGLGNLAQDWLANTLDPTPVFSLIIEITHKLFAFEPLYYIYYALLLGIYLFSLMGIVAQFYDIRSSRSRYLVYLALLIAMHSAVLRYALGRTIGYNLAYVFEDGFGDQRLLGPVFQPSSFGVFLLFSIYLFLRGRTFWAVLAAVLAATVHPTYLLGAAALVAAYMLILASPSFPALARWLGFPSVQATLKHAAVRGIQKSDLSRFWTPPIRNALRTGLIALVAVAPILSYAYFQFGSTPSDAAARARDILVNYRIPHHAMISWWFDLSAVIKLVLIGWALVIARRQRFFGLLLVPAAISAVLTLAQVVTGSDFLALIFPWRISTFIVPLSTALILAWLVSSLFDDFTPWIDRYSKPIEVASLALITAVVLGGAIRLALDFDRKTSEPEGEMTAFVARTNLPGQTYLTPIKLQDFRLESGAPAYVDFKSIPYRDEDVLEWYRRVQLADDFYLNQDCSLLPAFRLEGVTHVILPADQFTQVCTGLEGIYQDGSYGVFEVH